MMASSHGHECRPIHPRFDLNPEKSVSNDVEASIQGPGRHLNDVADVVNIEQNDNSNNVHSDMLGSESCLNDKIEDVIDTVQNSNNLNANMHGFGSHLDDKTQDVKI